MWLVCDFDDNVIILLCDDNEWCDVGVEGYLVEVLDSGQWSEIDSDDGLWEMYSVISFLSCSEDFLCESDCDCILVQIKLICQI